MSIVWSMVVVSQPDISIVVEGGIVRALLAGWRSSEECALAENLCGLND